VRQKHLSAAHTYVGT